MRVQYSVFECEITPAQWVELKEALLDIYDPDKGQSAVLSPGFQVETQGGTLRRKRNARTCCGIP